MEVCHATNPMFSSFNENIYRQYGMLSPCLSSFWASSTSYSLIMLIDLLALLQRQDRGPWMLGFSAKRARSLFETLNVRMGLAIFSKLVKWCVESLFQWLPPDEAGCLNVGTMQSSFCIWSFGASCLGLFLYFSLHFLLVDYLTHLSHSRDSTNWKR